MPQKIRRAASPHASIHMGPQFRGSRHKTEKVTASTHLKVLFPKTCPKLICEIPFISHMCGQKPDVHPSSRAPRQSQFGPLGFASTWQTHRLNCNVCPDSIMTLLHRCCPAFLLVALFFGAERQTRNLKT